MPCRRRRVLITSGGHSHRAQPTGNASVKRTPPICTKRRAQRIFSFRPHIRNCRRRRRERRVRRAPRPPHHSTRRQKNTPLLPHRMIYRVAGQRSNPLGEVAFVIGAAKRARRDDANVGGMFAQCCRVLANRVSVRCIAASSKWPRSRSPSPIRVPIDRCNTATGGRWLNPQPARAWSSCRSK